jgi:hypothetical protein
VPEYPNDALGGENTGFDFAPNLGMVGIEQHYDGYLIAHRRDPQTPRQRLFGQKLQQPRRT